MLKKPAPEQGEAGRCRLLAAAIDGQKSRSIRPAERGFAD
jgi:hypothetical protein